jgi:hypothetical protein
MTGMDRTLTVTDLDQHGRDLDTGPVAWTATGGSVDTEGVFQAGPD